MTLVAVLTWLYWRAMLVCIGLALLVALATGALVLGATRRLADLTSHRRTILVPAAGDEHFYWAALSTGFGMWSLIGWLIG